MARKVQRPFSKHVGILQYSFSERKWFYDGGKGIYLENGYWHFGTGDVIRQADAREIADINSVLPEINAIERVCDAQDCNLSCRKRSCACKKCVKHGTCNTGCYVCHRSGVQTKRTACAHQEMRLI